MNRKLSVLPGLLIFWLLVGPVYATSPDVAFAPPPQLSQPAWKELLHTATDGKEVMLHAQIRVFGGIIRDVTIQEIEQWPVTSSEVQLWIRRKWRFTPNFSGKVIQPVSFEVTHTAPQAASTEDPSSEHSDVLLRSPSPIFPTGYTQSVRNYMLSHRMSTPGVLLLMTVRDGKLTDIRVIDQRGPDRLCEYTVQWVRDNWQFRPGVTDTFRIPVYYVVHLASD